MDEAEEAPDEDLLPGKGGLNGMDGGDECLDERSRREEVDRNSGWSVPSCMC